METEICTFLEFVPYTRVEFSASPAAVLTRVLERE